MTTEIPLSAICANCIEDKYLKNIILEEGESRPCSQCCEEQPSTFTAEEFGKLSEPILRERLAWGEDKRVFHSVDDEKGTWEQMGDPLDYFVSEAIGQDLDFLEEIVAAVIDAENVWPPGGEEAFFEDYLAYVPRHADIGEMLERWEMVQNELQYSKRFFSSSAQSFFKSIFSEMDTLFAPQEDYGGPTQVVQELPIYTDIYRARLIHSEAALHQFIEAPYKHVGPPPSEKAHAGRMNSDGIVVLYGAMDIDTTLAEMRLPLSCRTILITLQTTKPLRILDFQRLEHAYSLKALSYFQPDFSYQLDKHAFLQRLHALISRPILPGKEIEYLSHQEGDAINDIRLYRSGLQSNLPAQRRRLHQPRSD